MSQNRKKLVFLPLGGLGEIGMNLALYGIGTSANRRWIMIDLGVSFADDYYPGVDLIMPDISFIEEQAKRLHAIVLTHAHEDHFGAVMHLWPRLKAPIYATPFAAALLRVKMAEEGIYDKIPIHEIPLGGTFDTGPFSCEFVSVSHSIPEPAAVFIKTELGNLVHTGDWKIDPNPTIGNLLDVERFKQIGDEGCKALICDSTNIFREGVSKGEGDVSETLHDIIGNLDKRVVLTTFASNVARIRSTAIAAAHANRDVVISGRAMQRMIGVARELGYIEDKLEFYDHNIFPELPRKNVVLICTGSQGEPRAALAKIANDEHPTVSLTSGDTVIFSARTIPGNEKAVSRVKNGLIKQGVQIIDDGDALVHVSGHPRRGELEQMYQWVRPDILIPAHGERRHLVEHEKFATSKGVASVVLAENGILVQIAPGTPSVIDEIDNGRLIKDGAFILDETDHAIKERRQLGYVGMIVVSFVIDLKGSMTSNPEVRFRGVAYDETEEDLEDFILEIVEDTFETLPRPRRKVPESAAESIRRAVRSQIETIWNKKPVCEVIVHQV